MKDMNGQTILLISDMRQVYLAEILTKKGMSVRCLDIRNSQTVEEQLLKYRRCQNSGDRIRKLWKGDRKETPGTGSEGDSACQTPRDKKAGKRRWIVCS